MYRSNAVNELRLAGVNVALLKSTPIVVKTLYSKKPYFLPNKKPQFKN
jgi:hypothetical protein